MYSWRGADFTNLEKFKDDFPEAQTFTLERNYRSTQPILTAAYNVISNNNGHPILKLWTDKEKGEEVQVVGLENDEEESVFVISTVRTLIEEEGYSPSEIAILYRVNAQSRIFEEMLIRAGISYKIYGGVRFYERKEIKDVLACLRLVLNPQEKLSLDRIDKLGKKRSHAIQEKLKKIEPTLAPEKLLQAILDKTPYLELLDPDDEADASRLENIKELVSVAHSFATIQDFLDTIALVETGYEQEDSKVEARVNLMSIHAAKGLEFRAVFVVGLEDGNLPHTRSLTNDKSLQEERRLLYVAITRAQERLYLTFVKRRMVYGRTQYYLPSQFLTEAGLVTDTSITF
ncbi:MAG: ATP-binding domain-containing protein [Candidatus Roizmanbacteria bacterium]|nr:ATP-binding domain-containing protein [Candidatus Roizmanbacteria bacterium]